MNEVYQLSKKIENLFKNPYYEREIPSEIYDADILWNASHLLTKILHKAEIKNLISTKSDNIRVALFNHNKRLDMYHLFLNLPKTKKNKKKTLCSS